MSEGEGARTLPPGWAWATIGEVCVLVNGRAFKPDEWSDSGLPIIRIQNLNNQNAKFNFYSGSFDERHRVKKDDLLFAWSGTPGTSFGAHLWIGPEAILNQHIFNVREANVVTRRYLQRAMNHRLDALIDAAHGGAGLAHVTKPVLEATTIPVPPLPEQRRIVAKLDELLATSRRAREALDAVPALLDQYRRSVLAAAFRGELTADWRDAHSTDGEWFEVNLGEVASDFSYGTAAKSSKEGRTPVLRMGNIQQGSLVWGDLVFTSDSSEESKYALTAGDVLFNRTNSPELVGKTAVYLGERAAIYAGYLIRVRCLPILDPKFLSICLNSPQGRDYCWRVKSDGVSQSNISASKLREFRFGLPSIAEQQEIVRRIDAAIARIDAVHAHVAEQRVQLDALDRAILDKAFHGALVPQDPNDEPASVMLERLRAERAAAGTEKKPRGRRRTRDAEA